MEKNIIKAEQVITQKVRQVTTVQDLSREERREQIDSLVKLLFKDFRRVG
ncbi:MAG: hypothetical protein MI700_13085 [Balneolales bacterium]|nr:hypothetical protein [Balneolales bacterium]